MSILKREIKTTNDGSKTITIPDWDESYHSKHGALQEAKHVFLKNGLDLLKSSESIHVLEYGFGTGLNAILANKWSILNKKKLIYHSLEKFPLEHYEWETLDYPALIDNAPITKTYFEKMHYSEWETEVEISKFLSLKKIFADFKEFNPKEDFYDIVFFDAFGKRVQPELWSINIFEKIFKGLKNSGLFTTYASNGSTQRALKEVGFIVEKKPGPPGKREMINAWKK